MTLSASRKQVAELVEEVAHARVAMRLDDGDDAPLGAGAGGLQHGGDLGRMMAVVVDRSAMPFHVPVSWKRRLTPENAASPARMTSSAMPASAATAIAASALSALCWPGIGTDQPLRLRAPPLTRAPSSASKSVERPSERTPRSTRSAPVATCRR